MKVFSSRKAPTISGVQGDNEGGVMSVINQFCYNLKSIINNMIQNINKLWKPSIPRFMNESENKI